MFHNLLLHFLVDSRSQLEKCANLMLFSICFHFFLVIWLCNLDIFKNYIDFTLEIWFTFLYSLCLNDTHPYLAFQRMRIFLLTLLMIDISLIFGQSLNGCTFLYSSLFIDTFLFSPLKNVSILFPVLTILVIAIRLVTRYGKVFI